MTAERKLIDRYAGAAGGPDLQGLKHVQSERAQDLVRRLTAEHTVAVLGDPVGTGKTVVALTVAARLLARRIVDTVVVVTPNAVVRRIWEERAIHFGTAFPAGTLRVYTAASVPASVKRPALVIVDEAHRKLHRDDLRKLIRSGPGQGSQRRLFLTATPFQIAVSDLAELIQLGDREKCTAGVVAALKEYGHTVTRLARRAHQDPDRYVAERLRRAADEWAAQGSTVVLPALTHEEEKQIGLSAMPFPRKVDVRMGTDAWTEAFHVARIVPELVTDGVTRSRATDSFQRGLSSSIEAFWAHKGTEELRRRGGRIGALRRELEERLGSSTDHPKVAFTTDWVVEQVRKGSHVAVFCVWDATARELQETIAGRLIDEGVDGDVYRPGVSIGKAMGKRFRSKSAAPLVLILQERFSESIDLDGGDPALVHHDLPWNPARLRQRWGRFVRASSEFTPIPPRKMLVPVLQHETDQRIYETVRVRYGIGEVLLSDETALEDRDDREIDPVDWVLRNLRPQT